jgi:hypothetical protein
MRWEIYTGERVGCVCVGKDEGKEGRGKEARRDVY